MPSLPPDFLNSAKKFAGDEYQAFIESFDKQPPVSIRTNPFKQTGKFNYDENILWSVNGRYLKERPSFTLDPFFHAGCYYVQDASSQFLEVPFLQAKKILDRPLIVLDLCAAPGGKSTHLLSLIGQEDLLVSNEIISSRNNILRQNIIKWGCANSIVTQNDPAQLAELKKVFDIIVVDSPCSGEGLFRKDPEAIEEWSPENVKMCAIRQNEILDHAYRMLKPDGILIYSTCTYEERENDDQVERLIKNQDMSVLTIQKSDAGILNTKHGLSFFPHRIKGEGFYISMLRKDAIEIATTFKNIKHGDKKPPSWSNYIKEPDSFTFFSNKEIHFAIPSVHFPAFTHIKNNAYVRLAGINIGELKGKDFIPSEMLALSNDFSNNFPVAEVNTENALTFLRGNAPVINAENGFVVIRHEGFNLGWIKKIGSRVNNYYPKEWRIRNR